MGALGQEKRSARKKWLFGCAGGCLGFITIAAIVVGILVYLGIRAVPLVPARTFLGSHTDAFFIAQIEAEDQPLAALLEELLSHPPEAVERHEDQIRQWREQIGNTRRMLDAIGAIRVIRTLQYDRTGEREPTAAFALSVRRMSGILRRLFHYLLRQERMSLTEYKGISIASDGDGFSMAAKENNFMFAHDMEAIKEWIDRIDGVKEVAPEGGAPMTAFGGKASLNAVYDTLPQDAAIRCGSANEHGEVRALLSGEEDVELLPGLSELGGAQIAQRLEKLGLVDEEVEALGLCLDLLSAQEAHVRVFAVCRDNQFAQRLAERLQKGGPSIEDRSGITDWQANADGRIVALELRIPDFLDRVKAAVRQETE